MSHTLTFSQLVGTFTVDKELLGAQDPYVIFEAGGNKCQTKAIKSVGAGSAEWKETYELKEFSAKSAIKEVASKSSSTNSSTVLEVTAWNHNTLRPDGTIGSGTVDLSRLGSSQLSGSGDRVTVHLTDKKGKSVGELKFLIHGGGYQGSGSSSSTGQGMSSATGYGVGQQGTGYGQQGTGSGYGQQGTDSSSSRGPVTGVGSGPTHGVAHQAARKAAHEGDDVQIRTREGVATGHPTGAGYDNMEGGQRGVHGHSQGVDSSSTTGLSAQQTSGTRGMNVGAGEVIDRKYYTGVEDRPQEQALVEQYREHNPYAKEYETTVQHTGRERQIGSSIEAMGTQERVVDSHHHVHGQPHDLIARALPEGAISDRPGGEGWVQGKVGPVCDSTKFEVTGDRTVDKERVTNLREHREFEKEFEVKTALVGERELAHAAETEQLKRERILLDEKNKIACVGHPSVDVNTGGAPAAGYGQGVTGGHQSSGQGLTGAHQSSGQGLTGAHHSSGQGLTGGHHSSGQGLGQGERAATHEHGSQGVGGYGTGQGTSGQGVGGYGTGQGTSGQGIGGYGTGQGTTGQGTTGQEGKGIFQTVKDAVTGTGHSKPAPTY